MDSAAGPVVYRIDAGDRLSSVNAEWDRFAVENGAAELRSGRVLARTIWDFIADPTTRHLYETALAQVRAGREVRFPFRCDGPQIRRFLEMTATAAGEGGVEFRVRTLKTESRAAVRLLDPEVPRAGEPLRMCAWCKRVVAGGAYLEVEDAIAALGLFDAPVLPPVTHGICPACEARMSEKFGLSPRA